MQKTPNTRFKEIFGIENGQEYRDLYLHRTVQIKSMSSMIKELSALELNRSNLANSDIR